MLTRYYDSFRNPTIDLFDAFKIFDDYEKTYKSETIDNEGVKIELPGVKASDVDVSVEGKMLRITGKSRHGKDFKYVYSLKSNADESNISAKLEDGLLSITIPKKSEQSIRKILIST
jgi:HSP20 family protein